MQQGLGESGGVYYGRRSTKQERTERIITEPPFTKYPAHSLARPAFAYPGVRGNNSIRTPYRWSWSAVRNIRTKSRKRRKNRKNRKKGWLLDVQWAPKTVHQHSSLR